MDERRVAAELVRLAKELTAKVDVSGTPRARKAAYRGLWVTLDGGEVTGSVYFRQEVSFIREDAKGIATIMKRFGERVEKVASKSPAEMRPDGDVRMGSKASEPSSVLLTVPYVVKFGGAKGAGAVVEYLEKNPNVGKFTNWLD